MLDSKTAVIVHLHGRDRRCASPRIYPDRTTRLVLEDPIGLEDYRFFSAPVHRSQVKELGIDSEKYRAFVKRLFVNWKRSMSLSDTRPDDAP